MGLASLAGTGLHEPGGKRSRLWKSSRILGKHTHVVLLIEDVIAVKTTRDTDSRGHYGNAVKDRSRPGYWYRNDGNGLQARVRYRTMAARTGRPRRVPVLMLSQLLQFSEQGFTCPTASAYAPKNLISFACPGLSLPNVDENGRREYPASDFCKISSSAVGL